MDNNPTLDELDGLSPNAKAALVQAHSRIIGPMAGTSAPPPVVTPQASAQPQAQPATPRTIAPPTDLPMVTQPQQQPPNPVMQGHQAELARLTAPPPSDPTQMHTHENTGAPGFEQIHNPFLRGLATVGNIATGFFPRIAPLIPGTTAHHNMLVGQEGRAVNQDEAQAQDAAKIRQETALATQEEAKAQSLTHPPAKEPKDPTNAFELWHQQNPDAPASEWLKTEEGSKTQKEAQTPFAEWLRQNPGGKVEDWLKLDAANKPQKEGNDFEQFYKQYLGDNKLTDSAANRLSAEQKFSTAKQPPQRPPQVTVMIPNANGGYTAQLVHPGQDVAPGAVTTAGMNTQNVPTSQMRNAAAQAELVHSETPRVLANIDHNAAKLGPVLGRWNEFMQGKVGSNDPALADVRADLLMYSSAVALAHARGRLPENLREEFDHAINAPQQTAENLKATISRIDQWMADNAHAFGSHAAGNQGGGEPPTITTKEQFDRLPKGAVYMEDGKKYRKP